MAKKEEVKHYHEIQILCEACKGTGVKTFGHPTVSEPCTKCDSTGYKVWGRMVLKKGDE